MTTATIKKIKAAKPPYPFEAYSHIISLIPKEDGGAGAEDSLENIYLK